MIKKFTALILALVLTLALSGCGEVTIPDEEGWVATWASAQLVAGTNEFPMNPPLKENTCRQQIRVNIGGDKIRLTLSNEYGELPAMFDSVHIAHLVNAGENAIDLSTDTVVTFGGKESFQIEAGQTMTSDEIDFSFGALDDLAITLKCGKYAGSSATSHTGARCSTWLISGDHVLDESFVAEETMTSWYFISELDTWAEAGTKSVVLFGDSITDGYGSNTNQFERWSDEMNRLFRADPNYSNICVINEGIGGNSIFGGLGTAAKDRFDRDVLNIAGVRYVVLLIGINDIGYASDDISNSMIDEYKVMIDKCHEKGIKVYAGTILPIGGNDYYSELHDKIRNNVNDWIRSKKADFDGVIDFDELMRSSDDPSTMNPEYSLDNLHPNPVGYKKMGEFAYKKMLEFWAK